MSPGHIFILALIIVFLFMFAVGSTEYSLPFFQRIKFDNICNKYLAVIQANGGLDANDRTNLINALEAIGFINVSIEAPIKVSWNEEARLEVEADYIYKVTKSTLSKEENVIRAIYNNKTRVMTLER
jgi:hypothetical protein